MNTSRRFRLTQFFLPLSGLHSLHHFGAPPISGLTGFHQPMRGKNRRALWEHRGSPHIWDIRAAMFPSAPIKTVVRTEERLSGENTCHEWSSSPIFNKLMAKVPFASQRAFIGGGLYQKPNRSTSTMPSASHLLVRALSVDTGCGQQSSCTLKHPCLILETCG